LVKGRKDEAGASRKGEGIIDSEGEGKSPIGTIKQCVNKK